MGDHQPDDETVANMGHPAVTRQRFGNRYRMDAIEIKFS
jgi:hypothetical protein